MISIARRGIGPLFRLSLALAAFAALASCSGAVSGPPQVTDPSRITILPDTAILYSGMPTTFTISGGTGSYLASSSNQAVVHVSGAVSQGRLTVIPANVTAETEVTLTVRDTGTTPLATATLTVRPGTVSNEIAITPSGTQGGSCAPALCSGGDAAVSATISQGGVPLPARGVRLDVVSGDFRFITSPPGVPEILETTTTVITDQAGMVHARIRALPGAANQTALLQVTDLGTNAFRRTAFLIAQATGESPGFFVTPDAVTFTGPRQGLCASNVTATFFVFGGTPPYSIFNTGNSFFAVSVDTVTSSGASFNVSPRSGTCVAEPGLPILVRDSAGRTTTVTVANVEGDDEVPALVVAPDTVTLTSCTTVANVAIAGGTGTYFITGDNDLVSATRSGNTISIRRKPSTLGAPGPAFVAVSDGISTATITVNLQGQGAATCGP